jgi:hypothetical protein
MTSQGGRIKIHMVEEFELTEFSTQELTQELAEN